MITSIMVLIIGFLLFERIRMQNLLNEISVTNKSFMDRKINKVEKTTNVEYGIENVQDEDVEKLYIQYPYPSIDEDANRSKFYPNCSFGRDEDFDGIPAYRRLLSTPANLRT